MHKTLLTYFPLQDLLVNILSKNSPSSPGSNVVGMTTYRPAFKVHRLKTFRDIAYSDPDAFSLIACNRYLRFAST